MIDGKGITFYRKSLTSLKIFNTFEWRTLQVAFLPYPKNAETGRHHCLQNVFACKHACMQTCLFANMPTYKHAYLQTCLLTYIYAYQVMNSNLPTSRHKRYLKE